MARASADRFAGARAKVARASEHIEQFHQLEADTGASGSLIVDMRDELETEQRHYYLAEDPPIPARLSVVAGDAPNGLRSALDHATYAVCDTAKMTEKNVRQLYFPVSADRTAYEQRVALTIAPWVAESVAEHFLRLEPYPGGKDADIRHLDALNNIDKHRLLVTTAMQSVGVDIAAWGFGALKSAFPDCAVSVPVYAAVRVCPEGGHARELVGDSDLVPSPRALAAAHPPAQSRGGVRRDGFAALLPR